MDSNKSPRIPNEAIAIKAAMTKKKSVDRYQAKLKTAAYTATVANAPATPSHDLPGLIDGARERYFHPATLGADKGYDTCDLVAERRKRRVTPHVAPEHQPATERH